MILSPTFWIFSLLGPLVYWLLPIHLRLGVAAIISCGVIAYFDASSAGFLAVSVFAVDFSLRIYQRNAQMGSRLFLLLGGVIAANIILCKLGMIQTFFHAGEIQGGILLPLGISYYSFKLIHFIIESFRGRIENYRFDLFSIYIFLPTAFSAGPIQRFDRFVSERLPHFDWSHVSTGITRIAHGLIKQFVIVGIVLNSLSPDLAGVELIAKLDTMGLWLYLIVFYLKLYLNFSAYTDIAIGTSRLFGFVIMENFHFPFLATSIDVFWHRWHMTLSGWCREYVYQPLLGLFRQPVLAAYVTFVVIGLWHAFTLSRLIWGLMHGTALVCYFFVRNRRRKKRRTMPGFQGSKETSTSLKIGTFLSWLTTQGFVVMSMAALVVEDNDVVSIGKIIFRLLP